ncbi:MAG: hypothetical protein ABSB36_05225 [Candidatus Dormibacteria bacterium]|jgi:hypothetical protein
MENRKSKRSVRLALVLGAAVAGTALVGWGGLAAWQAYTQNTGSTFAVGTLTHTNQVAGSTTVCNSTVSATSPGACQIIVGGPIGSPDQLTSSFAGTSGAVTITNTGSLSSNFTMSMQAPAASELCADLTLTVTDNETSPATVYPLASLASAMAPVTLKNSSGATSWATNDSNKFTFAIAPSGNFATDDGVLGTSCSFTILFDQASA